MDVGFFETIARDLSGKGQFRLILQPLAALILGIRFGIADANAGKAPFLNRLIMHRHQRWTIFKESLSDAVFPLVVALVMDGVLQHITFGRIRPLAALVVGALLVWLPFVATRAITNRIWKRIRDRRFCARPRTA
jgi:hypothetical protein